MHLVCPAAFLALFATQALSGEAPSSPQAASVLQAESAKNLGLPKTWTSPSGLEFVLIPAGAFLMGESGTPDAPKHPVTISQPFYLGMTEVTKAQWRTATWKIHSTVFEGDELPMNFVTYRQAIDACAVLSKEIPGVRLPTEAEWEFAARAGESSSGTGPSLETRAWSAENSDNALKAVRRKAPNAFGLYDMQGNVWEWCSDFYDDTYYQRSPDLDPTGPEKSLYSYRVLRGGSALFGEEAARLGNRGFAQASRTRPDIGLRLAFSVSEVFRELCGLEESAGSPGRPFKNKP